MKVLPKRAATARTYGAEDKTNKRKTTIGSTNVGTSTDAGLILSNKKSDDNEASMKKVLVKRTIKKESDDESAHKGNL